MKKLNYGLLVKYLTVISSFATYRINIDTGVRNQTGDDLGIKIYLTPRKGLAFDLIWLLSNWSNLSMAIGHNLNPNLIQKLSHCLTRVGVKSKQKTDELQTSNLTNDHLICFSLLWKQDLASNRFFECVRLNSALKSLLTPIREH